MKPRHKGGALTLGRVYANCRQSGNCKLWKGAINKAGYPFVYTPELYAKTGRNGMVSGRVAVWRLTRGEVPQGRKLAMSCGNRLCLAQNHLLALTFSEAQKLAKTFGAYDSMRRRISCIANSRKRAILTDETAAQIRAAVAAGGDRQAIADAHGVKRNTVNQVARGIGWNVAAIPQSSIFNLAACAA